jgi:hypothetical protein
VLGYDALATGLATVPTATASVLVAVAVAPRAVHRFGPALSMVVGSLSVVSGLAYLATATARARYVPDLLPGFVALGAGIGLSGVAAQVAAFAGVRESSAGLAGGLIETSREIGAALSIAVVASASIVHATDAVAGGFRRGMLAAAAIGLLGATTGWLVRRGAGSEEQAPSAVVPTDPTTAPASPRGATDHEPAVIMCTAGREDRR